MNGGLSSPVQYLKGVGPKRASYLKRVGVETIEDLLLLIPRKYIDRTKIKNIVNLKVGEEATILGKIILSDTRMTRNKGELVVVAVSDGERIIHSVWFNRPDLKGKFKPGMKVILSGIVSFYKRFQFTNPYYEILGKERSLSYTGTVIPIYPLTEGLSLWDIRKFEKTATSQYLHLFQESLPDYLLRLRRLYPLKEAIRRIHFPDSIPQAEEAKRRLVYDELFYFETLLARRRLKNSSLRKGFPLQEKGKLLERFKTLLPFNFTQAQKRVLEELKSDMARESPMNRLLQGDVGSGKTVLAIYCMLIAVENEFQACLMAPTEILAEQHYFVWRDILSKLGVCTFLLTGSLSQKEKREAYKRIEKGEVDIIFGTHALIEEGVKFNKLGLAVVDEQHRFGVMQRAALLNKGLNPHFLVMTATPIPRTLALTLYGDLDISTLDEKPPGRKEIITRLIRDRNRLYQFLRERMGKGEQVYVVCPLIKESEKLDLASAIKTYESLSKIFREFKVGLLHGELPSQERFRIMEEFRKGEISLLVSTTVIEVGVDVPKATVMVIEHPERFGLAQLHQLRGRVGRGREESYCFLISKEEMDRLRFFTENDDGFKLAEKDLEIRGPGQFFGTRQHGLPDLRIADLRRDLPTLSIARKDAFSIIEKDPEFKEPEHYIIKRTLLRKFSKREGLLDVG